MQSVLEAPLNICHRRTYPAACRSCAKTVQFQTSSLFQRYDEFTLQYMLPRPFGPAHFCLLPARPYFQQRKMPAGKSPWHFHTFYLYFFSGGAQELQPPHDPQSPEHKPFPDFFFLIKLCKIAETIAINTSNTMIVPISFTSKPAQKSHIFIY